MQIPYPIAAGLRIAALSYLGMLALLAIGQRRLIYHPARAPAGALLTLAAQAGLLPWRNLAGELIGWRTPPSSAPDAPRALVFHGNAGHALDRLYFAAGFGALSPPWETLLFEYPGYGSRAGRPAEKAILAAAEDALRELPADGRPLFVVGESLGTGVAAALAARHPERVAGLLLITPFTSLADVGQRHYPLFPVRLMLRERYDSRAALQQYRGPAAFLLADADEVVSTESGRQLYESYRGPKRLWRQAGGHNTLDYTPAAAWWAAAANFLQNQD